MFNNNLAVALDNRNMTFEQLAGRCGITESEAKSYTQADVYPDPPTLQKMADVLHLKVRDIAGDEPLTFTYFGNELKELRNKNGMSRPELAELLDIDYSRLAKWENGKANPNEKYMNKLADLFGDELKAIVRKYRLDTPKSVHKTMPKKIYMTEPKTPDDISWGKRIGQALLDVRKRLGVSKAYMAESLGISQTGMFRLENGYIPQGEIVTQIKNLFDVDVEALRPHEVKTKPHEVEPQIEDKHEVKSQFKPVWIEYLDMIDDDGEYRRTTTALLNHVVNGVEITSLPDSPQGNIILKMIAKGV